MVSKLSENNPVCSSLIRILILYPSRIPHPGVKKAPDPGYRIRICNTDFMGYQLTDNGHWQLWECPKEEDHVDTAPELGGVQSYSVVRHSTAKKNSQVSSFAYKAVLGIWIRLRLLLGLPDPDPLVRGTNPDLAPPPDPSLFP